MIHNLRAEQVELDEPHVATCTAGCRKLPIEWPSDDEQAEADCRPVMREEERLKEKK